MAALTTAYDAQRKEADEVNYLMSNGVTIFRHGLVFVRVADGFAYPARSGTATDIFVGVAYGNKTAGAVAGVDGVVVRKTGTFVYSGTGFAQTDIGSTVYALDDNNVTKTSTSNVAVGAIVDVLSATQVRINIAGAVK